MALYVSVPRDLSRVKHKVLFRLTKRQLICFGTAALIGVPVFFLIRSSGNLSLAMFLMLAVMLPLFLLAMYERDGQPLEVVIGHILNAMVFRPRIRLYKTENRFETTKKGGHDETEKKTASKKRSRSDGCGSFTL